MVREQDVTIVTQTLSRGEEVSSGPPCLVTFYGDNLGRKLELHDGEFIFGRSSSAEVQVVQKSVSREHARIVVEDGKAHIADLGSTNGTFVNDRKVGEAELRDGDLLRIGQTIFKYLSGGNLEAKYHEEIYRLSTIDGLTRTYNKRYFEEAIDRELRRANRYSRDLSLVLFDIDHFKVTNDTHGHLAGDFILRELASLVSENLRTDDVFARYGGEEFAIILPETQRSVADAVCEKIRELVEGNLFNYNGEDIKVTISIGIAGFKQMKMQNPPNPIDFIAAADAQLYSAKRGGRNRVCAA